MGRYYKLDDSGEAVPATAAEWSLTFGDLAARTVARDDAGGAVVSTVFLGLDHGHDPDRPLIWETMVFAGDHPAIDQDCERCATRAEAVAQHARVLEETRTHLASCGARCARGDD